MKRKKISLVIFLVIITCFLTGCRQDDMEDIEIITTNYPNEYIINKLYGSYATINSIYPDGVNISNYKITKKQKLEYSKKGLFVYNGLIEKERDLAVELLDLNNELKIIDSAYVLETDYSPEELWLNPSSLLMMSQNVRIGLKEYITSSYLKKDIDKNYNKLKVDLSELDADYRVAVENSKNKIIVVNDSSLKFLEKFGLTVYCLDDDISNKDLNDVYNLINKGIISYIYLYNGDELTSTSTNIINSFPAVSKLEINKLDNITDQERDNKQDYLSIMNDNLELLKKELY